MRERLGSAEVRLLKLQLCQVMHFDQGVPRSPRMLSVPAALLAVQVAVGAVVIVHPTTPSVTDDIVTYDTIVSQG